MIKVQRRLKKGTWNSVYFLLSIKDHNQIFYVQKSKENVETFFDFVEIFVPPSPCFFGRRRQRRRRGNLFQITFVLSPDDKTSNNQLIIRDFLNFPRFLDY